MEPSLRKIDPGLPTLVAFPEDVGLMLVLAGMHRRLLGVRISRRHQRAVRALFVPRSLRRWRHRLDWVPALFLTRHAQIASIYFDVFSRAAKEYGVYLVGGSVVLPPYRLIERAGPLGARPA